MNDSVTLPSPAGNPDLHSEPSIDQGMIDQEIKERLHQMTDANHLSSGADDCGTAAPAGIGADLMAAFSTTAQPEAQAVQAAHSSAAVQEEPATANAVEPATAPNSETVPYGKASPDAPGADLQVASDDADAASADSASADADIELPAQPETTAPPAEAPPVLTEAEAAWVLASAETPPSLETITPELAKKWLTLNIKNRHISHGIVGRYAAQMKAGLWQINGETVKFNVEGKLIDGQHRLHAVVESGVDIEAYVVRGLPLEAFKTLDRGRKRNSADDLGIMGEANRTILSATLNLHYAWQQGNLNIATRGRNNTSSDDLIKILAEHPEIRQAVSRCARSPFRKMVPAATLAFAYHILATLDAEGAEEFFTRLELGTNLDLTDPIYRLREKLTDFKAKRTNVTKEETVALIFKAWNAKRQGKSMRACSWQRETEAFPYPT